MPKNYKPINREKTNWERQSAFNKETKDRVEDLEDRTTAINLTVTAI